MQSDATRPLSHAIVQLDRTTLCEGVNREADSRGVTFSPLTQTDRVLFPKERDLDAISRRATFPHSAIDSQAAFEADIVSVQVGGEGPLPRRLIR